MSTAGLDLDRILDVEWVRSQFPSLETQVNGQTAAFLDGPAGTQVPAGVIAAIQNYLISFNANSGGVFQTSCRSDEMIANTRAAMANFLHCEANEVVFGPNITTLTEAAFSCVLFGWGSKVLGFNVKQQDFRFRNFSHLFSSSQ